jgi:ssDNA-specific exonuclease RecJ
MKTVKVHFDGSVLVPDEPVDFPLNRPLELSVVSLGKPSDVPAALDKLAVLAQNCPARASIHTDLAAQHDHYLYGAPKRP